MIFLEAVIVNVFVFVLFMYVDRFLLGSYCKEHKHLDRAFKVWLCITAVTVFLVMLGAMIEYQKLQVVEPYI